VVLPFRLFESRPSTDVQAPNLQIHPFRYPLGKFREALECVSVSRDEFAFSILNVSECAEPSIFNS
jgi:hypothetical protein